MVCFKFDPEYFAAEEFELATWESKFVEQVHFNIETHQNEDLRKLLAKGILPYRDVGDVLRHALRRHLVLLESLGLLSHAAAHEWSRLSETRRAREWHRALNFKIVMDFANDLLLGNARSCTGRMLEIRILQSLISNCNRMPSPSLRRKHLEDFEKRFGSYMYDYCISKGWGDSVYLKRSSIDRSKPAEKRADE